MERRLISLLFYLIFIVSNTATKVYAEEIITFSNADPAKQATLYFFKATTNSDELYGEGRTQAEIVSKYNLFKPNSVDAAYIEEPSIISPYKAGQVDPTFLQNGLNYLNFVRYIAGLPDDVVFNDYYTKVSQHGAVLLAALDEFTHHPPKPQDMEQGFYQLGYSGTSHGNIAFEASISSMKHSIDLYMSDSDSYNTKTVGHRRWILNPSMGFTGYGMAANPSEEQYSVLYAHDESKYINFDSIAWPTKGAFPVYFLNMWGPVPWSISLNSSKYDNSRHSNVKVKLTNRQTGISWESDQSKDYQKTSTREYFNISTGNYGIPYCIIFNPGTLFQYKPNEIYDIEITGIFKNNSNIPTTINYSTSLFDLFPVTDVSINKSSATIIQGQTEQLTAIVSPSNVSNNAVTWSVSSQSGSNIATVSDKGLVTSVNPGAAVIRATSNADPMKYAECNVTVTVTPGADAEFSATPIVQVVINPNEGDSAGILIGVKDIRDTQGNSIPETMLASYQMEIYYDHNRVKIFDVVNQVNIGRFTLARGSNANKISVGGEFDQGISNYAKLIFVPLAVTGISTNSTNVIIKFPSMRDTKGHQIGISDVTLTFQRGKIVNESSQNTPSMADVIAGLQYLAELVNTGVEQGEVNVINMASITPPEVGATGMKPSIKDVIALMQKLIGLRDDTFQVVSD